MNQLAGFTTKDETEEKAAKHCIWKSEQEISQMECFWQRFTKWRKNRRAIRKLENGIKQVLENMMWF